MYNCNLKVQEGGSKFATCLFLLQYLCNMYQFATKYIFKNHLHIPETN